MNVDDAAGLRFGCIADCGFCCTASPLVLPAEAGALGSLVARAPDGSLRIPVRGVACGSLQPDARCGSYDARPSVCRVYPYQAHAGRRVQVVVTLACPGVGAGADGDDMPSGADAVARMLLALPGSDATVARAKETFAEFDRRMKEWGVHAPPDRLRAAFLPHVEALARPEALPSFFAGIADGALAFDRKPAHAVAALLEATPEHDLADLMEAAAREAFESCEDALWVEPDLRWTVPSWRDGRVHLARHTPRGAGATFDADVASLPSDWSPEASSVLADYLARLCRRDHTEGAAAWLVDASGYQATLPAAYARVLAEASLQVVTRAGVLAAEAGAAEVDAALARRGVAAYETSYHSLPTIGAIL